jgi:hypothetical protein
MSNHGIMNNLIDCHVILPESYKMSFVVNPHLILLISIQTSNMTVEKFLGWELNRDI